MPDWSPDGRFIAYISMRGADQSYGVLCIRDMESGTERDVQSDTGPVAHPRWSPDGRYVFARGYSQGRATLLRIDVQSGKSTLVLRESALNYAPSPYELAADGKSFYYQPASQKEFSNLASPIVRHDMESGAETRIQLATNSWMAPWAVSPDGKSIAFRGGWGKESFDGTFDLNVMSSNGGEPRVLLNASRVIPRSALAWTRDGRYVVFAKRLGPGAKDLLQRMPASGGEPENLGLEMEAIGDLRVSPNGRQLAFIAGRPNNKLQVWMMENFLPARKTAAREAGAEAKPSDSTENRAQKTSEPSAAKATGLTLRKLTEGGTTYGNSHPSPDGRYILMPWQNSMALLDVTTGEQREFGPNLDAPKFSRDGKQIVGTPRNFDGIRMKDRNELILFDVETETSRQLYRNEEIDLVTAHDWSPDQQTILASIEKKDRTAQIALISMSDGSARVLKSFDWLDRPSVLNFSPDGRWIAYAAKTGADRDLFLLAADGSREVPLHQQSGGRLLGWAPVGNRILFLSDRRGTWDAFAVQVVDGKPIGEAELVKPGIGQVHPMGFARDGSFFYELRTSTEDVFVANLDPGSGKIQGTPVNAARQFQGSNKFADWSPDGKSLAYISTRKRGYASYFGDLFIRSFETGTERELVTDAGDEGFVSKPRWSPDGQSFLAAGIKQGKWQLYRIDAQTGKSAFVFENPQPGAVPGILASEWARDGKSFYYPDERTSLFVRRDLETGAETKVQIDGRGFRAFPAPNGEQIAFYAFGVTNRAGHSINVMPAGGGAVRPLAELTKPYYLPGYAVVAWTPDSRYVVFAKWSIDDLKTTTLWRVPVTGGEPEYLGLEMERIQHPRISPDGRRIAFTASTWKHERWVMENFLPEQKVAAK